MKVQRYNIELIETLKIVVEIEARNLREAEDKAEALYENEKIVLDKCDFAGIEVREYKGIL